MFILDGQKFAVCRLCPLLDPVPEQCCQFSAKSGFGTKNMNDHLAKKHAAEWEEARRYVDKGIMLDLPVFDARAKRKATMYQSQLVVEDGQLQTTTKKLLPYTPDRGRTATNILIIKKQLPFNICDDDDWSDFLQVYCPEYIPAHGRFTARRDIVEVMYPRFHAFMKDYLAQQMSENTKFHIGADITTNEVQTKGLVYVWSIKQYIINFCLQVHCRYYSLCHPSLRAAAIYCGTASYASSSHW